MARATATRTAKEALPTEAPGTVALSSHSHKFIALDGLRGVAAIAVAIHHLHETLGMTWQFPNASLAADFFFMLSGFVLAHAYGSKIARPAYFWKFVVARVIRLYPLITLGTLAGAAVQLASGAPLDEISRLTVQGVLLVLNVSPSPYGKGIMPLDPPAWSLFFEMIVSLLFGLRLFSGRVILGAAIALSAAALIWAIASGHYAEGFTFQTLHYGFVRVLFGFPVGVFLYGVRDRIRVPRIGVLPAAIMLAAGLMLPWEGAAISLLLRLLVFPLMILGAANARDHQRLCRWSGDLSYPLYILHWPIYMAVALALRAEGLQGGSTLLGLGSLLTAIAVSMVILRIYDEPVRSYLTQLSRGSVRKAPAGT